MKLTAITSGYIFHYSFLIIFGLSLLLLVNFFALESVSLEFLFLQLCFISIFVLNFKLSNDYS